MENTETVATEAKPEVKTNSFSEFTGLMDGTITPTVKEESPVSTEETKKEEVTTEEKPFENTPISLDDEPSVEEKANTEKTATDADFDAKYIERFKKEFGDEPTIIKTKLSAEPAKPKYNTEFAKLADEYLPTGMSQSDFINFVATDFKTMEPIDLLDFKLSQESPELTPEDRELILLSKYGLNSEATPEQVALGKYQMGQDSKVALAEYEGKKAALINDKFEAKPTNQPDPQFVAQQEFWKKEAPNIIKAFDKLTITSKIPSIDDATKFEDVPITYQIPAKDQKLFGEWVASHGATAGVKTVEEMAAKLKDAFVAKNFEKLMQKQAERSASIVREQFAKKLANYEPPKGRTPQPTPAAKEGSIGHFFGAMDN